MTASSSYDSRWTSILLRAKLSRSRTPLPNSSNAAIFIAIIITIKRSHHNSTRRYSSGTAVNVLYQPAKKKPPKFARSSFNGLEENRERHGLYDVNRTPKKKCEWANHGKQSLPWMFRVVIFSVLFHFSSQLTNSEVTTPHGFGVCVCAFVFRIQKAPHLLG